MSFAIASNRHFDFSHAVVSDSAESLTTGGFMFNPNGSLSWIEQRDRLLERVAQQYSGVSDRVFQHLRRNSDLAWHLIAAYEALRREFGEPVGVRLDVSTDPDVADVTEQLIAYIHAPRSLESNLASLDAFDEQWLIENADTLAGRLSFDLDF